MTINQKNWQSLFFALSLMSITFGLLLAFGFFDVTPAGATIGDVGRGAPVKVFWEAFLQLINNAKDAYTWQAIVFGAFVMMPTFVFSILGFFLWKKAKMVGK